MSSARAENQYIVLPLADDFNFFMSSAIATNRYIVLPPADDFNIFFMSSAGATNRSYNLQATLMIYVFVVCSH